jgi:diguanylate cyclase (GGDEF)-like protein/PAS domain S-box-containing protein
MQSKLEERRRAEEALQESRLLLRAIIESLPIDVWVCGRDGRYIMQNATDIAHRGNTIGKTMEETAGLPEAVRSVRREEKRRVFAGETIRREVERIVAGETCYFYSMAAPVRVGDEIRSIVGINLDITQSKRTEQALHASLLRQSAILNNIPDLAWLKDEECRFIAVNEPFGRACGRRPEDLIGKTDLDIWPEELALAYRRDDLAVMRAGRRKDIEERLVDSTGRETWIETIKTPIYDADHKVIGTAGIARDITARKHAEKALRENEIIFSSFLEHSPVYVFFKDKELRSLRLSKNYEQMLGMPLSEALGKSMAELFPSELARSMVADDRRILAEGEVVKTIEEMNGRIYETTKFPVLVDGVPNLLAGFTLDITERKQAEDALRLSEARYRTLAQNLPDSALLLYDRDLRVILADGPELEAAGFSREILEGKPLQQALQPELVQLIQGNMERALAGEKLHSELAHRNRLYRCSYVPLRDDSGEIPFAMILATNITPLKQAEEALRESQRRLSNAMRATSVGVWEWDLRTNRAYWSDENYRVLGWKPGEIEARYENWASCLHPEDRPAAEAKVAEAVNGGGSLNIEFRVIWPDGSIHWINDIGDVLVGDNTGQPLGMYGIQMDVTERKQLEQERETLIRELENKNAESEILRESAAAVAFPLEFDETVSRILDQLKRAVPYDSASVQLLIGNELEVIGGQGFPEDRNPMGMRFVLDESDPAYPILRDGQPYILFPDIQLISKRFREFFHDHIHSWMAIPLYARSRLIGLLAIDGRVANKFTEAHARFALTFANQVAVTLENSRLYAELQLELKRQIALRGAITAISSSLKHNEVLGEICRQMASGIDATSAYIAHYDPKRTSLSIVAEYVSPSANEFEQVSDLGVIYYRKDGAWVFDAGDKMTPATIHVDDRDLTPWARNNLLSYGGKSILYLPLYVQGYLIGHAELWESRRKRVFSEEEISLCQAIAQQAAIAMENASLFEQLQEEKERAEVTLHSIGDAVITADIHARVQYLNPVAENLTGWTIEQAAGRPLVEVFRIIEEGSRQPAVSPVERCLQQGGVVGLANHSVLISQDGREFAIDDSAAPIRNRMGEMIGAVLVFHDVTEERRLSQQIAHDAIHDTLTGLVNRREFEKRLERALINTKEQKISHILCYLDLDQFKIVNDTAGHAAGDELLRQISRLLSGFFRQRDTLARLGGDEFGLLLENCQLDQALVIANEMKAKIRDYPFVWAGHGFHVGVSIGVVPITADKESISQLLSQADVACYSAKDLGRDRVYVYHAQDGEPTEQHREILQAARMRDAMFQNRFRLFCQPIVQVAGTQPALRQYEVLLRMADSSGHIVLPGALIPSAERYGLMHTIDQWVIRETLSTLAEHDIEQMLININISGNSLDDETLPQYVLQQLDEFSIPPEHICFEITETAAIHHLSKAQQFIHTFKERGGRIALDDFGSGFSSFRYLKSLSVDYIKIDGSFVSDMLSNPGDLLMVEAITRIAHTLGIKVIAEHASSVETIDRLREIGVDNAQGFGIGLPVPVQEAWRRRK